MHRGERKRSRKLSKALTQPAQRERCGRGGDSFPESCPEPPGRGWGWPADRGGTAGAAPYLPPPAPAPGGARASRYLDQPQDVTAVGGGGRADHEFSHFRLLLFFPLRTRPLYLNSRRRWFLIRLPGASSSQSGWHHDLADLGKRRKSRSRLRLNLRALAAAGSRFLAQRSPASGCEAEAPRPMRSRPPPSSGRRLLFRASVWTRRARAGARAGAVRCFAGLSRGAL